MSEEVIYFKKNDGEVITFVRGRMNLARLDAKFKRCDRAGNEIEEAKPKKKKAVKKSGGKK